jgi:hypothetical protein
MLLMGGGGGVVLLIDRITGSFFKLLSGSYCPDV